MCGATYTDEQIETAEGLETSPYIVSLLDKVFDEIGKRTEGQENYDPAVYGDVVIPAYAVGVFGRVVAGWMADSALRQQELAGEALTSLLDRIFGGDLDEGIDIPTAAFGEERVITDADLFRVEL